MRDRKYLLALAGSPFILWALRHLPHRVAGFVSIAILLALTVIVLTRWRDWGKLLRDERAELSSVPEEQAELSRQIRRLRREVKDLRREVKRLKRGLRARDGEA
jgi:cell division protein FtsB